MKNIPVRRLQTNRMPMTFTRATIGIMADAVGDESRAQWLAENLGLPLANPSGADEFTLLLVCAHDHLELRDARDPRTGPVYVDHSRLDLRPYSPNLSRRQPLARAFGKKVRTIADATAGYAQDALLLSLMGFRVTAIERSPIVAALAQDGLHRLRSQTGITLSEHLQMVNGDSCVLLPTLAPRPDAIYLDPMFPPKRRKSAAVKKEMRLLRELVGDDADALELLEISRGIAVGRVVVKRPDDAAPLAPDPNMSFAGKLVRYDVYLARHRTRT